MHCLIPASPLLPSLPSLPSLPFFPTRFLLPPLQRTLLLYSSLSPIVSQFIPPSLPSTIHPFLTTFLPPSLRLSSFLPPSLPRPSIPSSIHTPHPVPTSLLFLLHFVLPPYLSRSLHPCLPYFRSYFHSTSLPPVQISTYQRGAQRREAQ